MSETFKVSRKRMIDVLNEDLSRDTMALNFSVHILDLKPLRSEFKIDQTHMLGSQKGLEDAQRNYAEFKRFLEEGPSLAIVLVFGFTLPVNTSASARWVMPIRAMSLRCAS
jgi:hypothetical protein